VSPNFLSDRAAHRVSLDVARRHETPPRGVVVEGRQLLVLDKIRHGRRQLGDAILVVDAHRVRGLRAHVLRLMGLRVIKVLLEVSYALLNDREALSENREQSRTSIAARLESHDSIKASMRICRLFHRVNLRPTMLADYSIDSAEEFASERLRSELKSTYSNSHQNQKQQFLNPEIMCSKQA
jgi:hypothetical protein